MPRPDAPTPTGDPWPLAAGEHVASDEALRHVVARLRERAPTAIGLWVGPDPSRGRHDADDWRGARPGFVGLAVADDDDQQRVTWSIDPRAAVHPDALLQWLAQRDDGPYVVMHGAQVMLHRLRQWAGRGDAPVPARFGCTHSAAILLAEGTRRGAPSLPECVARALDRSWPLGPSDLLRAPAEPAVVAATSASVLVPLMRAMTPMLRGRELGRLFDLECQLIPAVIDMERAGVAIDAAGFQRIVDGWVREQATATEPERQARLAKLVSTYGYWPREYVVGDRIHCRLHPLAADSGRFSCTEPNLQQVPGPHVAPGLRACFGAAPDHALIVADYAQIELRVAAHLAPCEALRSVFREGRDPHRATAATLTNKPEPQVTDRERQLAKAVNFGFLFGMGAPRFRSYAHSSYGLSLEMSEARRAREAFLQTFPGIARWHARVSALGRGPSSGPVTVRTALGRRKRFEPGAMSFNAALNIPVQGTAAEGFKLAMTRLRPRLAQLGGRGILCVHDEYLAEVPTKSAQEGRSVVEEVMREAMAEVVDSVPIVVEAHVANTWADK